MTPRFTFIMIHHDRGVTYTLVSLGSTKGEVNTIQRTVLNNSPSTLTLIHLLSLFYQVKEGYV